MPDRDITPLQWIAENGPRDDHEASCAARALIRTRDIEEDLKLLDALTPFERELADRAASAAKRAVIHAVESAIGATAETVGASALRAAIKGDHAADLDFAQPQAPLDSQDFLTPERLRASSIVSSAARAAARHVGKPNFTVLS